MSLIHAISREARSRGIRVGVAESLSSGALASAIGAGEGASEWFAGGVIAYLRDVKEQVLGVRTGIDLCSAECAEQLAIGSAQLLNADVTISTTGVGGPGPEDGHESGTVFIGWYARGGVGHQEYRFSGDPASVLEQTVHAALVTLAHACAGDPL